MLFVVLFAVPSTIVGVALIGLWNRPGVAGRHLRHRRHVHPGVSGAVRSRRGADARRELSGTCRSRTRKRRPSAGAGWFRTMRRIVLPQLQLGLAAAWIVVFVLSFGELGASVLVAPAWRVDVAHSHLHDHRQRATGAGRRSALFCKRVVVFAARWRFSEPLHRSGRAVDGRRPLHQGCLQAIRLAPGAR